LLTPYKLESNTYGYTFLTDSGIYYRIALQDTSESFFPDCSSIKSFDISLICVSNKDQLSFDKRIALTISNMVKQLLVDGNVISFFCDISDNKHKARYRLFNQWFKKYGNEYFEKIDSESSYEDNVYYFSLLFDTRHYKRDTLEQLFQKSIDEYASYKSD
jgi:hypothetical protein